MKISIFQASQGDCLLLTGNDGTNLLVDGGMSGSYKDFVSRSMGRMARDGEDIDLVCVSHIDNDHIGGILRLMEDVAKWRVYEYQQSSGNNHFPKPKSRKPPEINGIWHNAFKDQVDDNTGEIEDQLISNTSLFNMSDRILPQELVAQAEHYNELATGVRQALRLSNRIGPNQLNIPLNEPFNDKLIFIEDLNDPPQKVSLGSMDLYLIAPTKKALENLRDDWNEWLEQNQEAVEKIREEAAEDADNFPLDEGQLFLSSLLALANELGDRGAVTPPNLASIMFLIEEGTKTVLLTGDGHADDILEGLKAQGKLDSEGRIHVNVLKIQHHGSEHNITSAFCESVSADHYIICGNGSHDNPDLDVLQLIIDSRLDETGNLPDTPFKLWFSSSSKTANTENRVKYMRKVEKLIKKISRENWGTVRHRFLTSGSKLVFEI